MNLVELTGPSGSGKSAIYKQMLSHGGFVPNPTLGEGAVEKDRFAKEVLRGYASAVPGVVDFISFLQFIFRTAQEPIPGSGKSVTGKTLSLRKQESGTFRALTKVVMARSSNDPRWLVVDGGLIHRGQGIDRIEPKMPVRCYFETMPLPDLVVAVTADVDVVKDRNRKRGGSHDRSADVERSFGLHATACNVLESRGVQMLSIDTTTVSPDENARLILDRMKESK